MTIYPVPQRPPQQPAKPVIAFAVFLPAAPPPNTELPPLVMAPVMPAGWPRM